MFPFTHASGYRPVAALLDIPVLKVDKSLKDKVQEQVVQEEGPTDATVIVSAADNSELSDETADRIPELFGDIGEIILVRWGRELSMNVL